MYNLFLDDGRNPNAFLKDIRTWVVVRSYDQFVQTISERGIPEFISFDHDLAFEHMLNTYRMNDMKIPYDMYKEKTGMDCAKWLVDYCINNHHPLPKFQVHSYNPVGRENIQSLLDSFRKSHENE
jgi:hypothetical protein